VARTRRSSRGITGVRHVKRWERPAALAGAQLPTLSHAFAEAVVNAADNDWQALAGGHAAVPLRHRRGWTLARQAPGCRKGPTLA
jgi:hypothetical protein